MSLKTMSQALSLYNENYASSRIDTQEFAGFNAEYNSFISKLNKAIEKHESEENIKKIINDFLGNAIYTSSDYSINTKNNIDSAICRNDKLLVMTETKSPDNKVEMLTTNDINRKALHELILYYLMESRDVDGSKVKRIDCEIRRLIATNGIEWFIFDANDIEKLCDGWLEKQYYKYKNNQLNYSKDNAKFYSDIGTYLLKIDLKRINYVYFNLQDIRFPKDKRELYKVLSAPFLFKEAPKLQINEHALNDKFYKELLYIMGLQEEKIDNKIQITINHKVENTFAAQLYKKFKHDKDIDDEDLVIEKTFELIIIWLNRLLFIKLFEGQLISFNSDSEDYRILDSNKIKSFDDLMELFFNVLGKNQRDDNEFFNRFKDIPYLNSSLFERQEIESRDVNINELKNESVTIKSHTIFGKKAPEKMPLLKYVIDFLNSYTFCSDAANRSSSEIIDAAVLGLIFEKINGYKDGAIYTPSVITEFISKETLSKVIVNKVNQKLSWNCDSLDDIPIMIKEIDLKERLSFRKQINEIINHITICDPAVGSGHFLVSALNYLIAVKQKIGVLFYTNTDDLVEDYTITVVDDVLTVLDGQEKDFVYNKNDVKSQKLQETLFNEKRTIIENCLFGVDINPKAVYICQLRLWIELLKNAYYKKGIMETLPNIDIKLKPGNSLIHKIKFSVGRSISIGNFDIKSDLKKYKEYNKEYIKTSDKRVKTGIRRKIEEIKYNLHTVPGIQLDLFDKKATEIGLDETYKGGFEWAIEFPELLDENGIFLGFDCVIGNPPYIQLQTMHEQADYLQNMEYETFARTGDIYCLFYELGYNLLKPNGILTFITSNKWMKAGYGKNLRDFFVRKTNPLLLIDFANIKIFDSATVDVNILEFSKQNNTYKTVSYLAEPDCLKNLSDFVNRASNYCSFKNDSSWTILNPIEQDIKSKIEGIGVPLKEMNVRIFRGVITGCNEAFIIDESTKERLIEEDARSAEIIRPILRGKDIKRYGYSFANLWLIATFPSKNYDINDYPAVRDYLLSFGMEKLEQTGKEYTINGEKIKARKKTTNKWFETQDSIAYWDDLFKQKIVYREISNNMDACLIPEEICINNKCYFLVGNNLEYLLLVFNSKLFNKLILKEVNSTGGKGNQFLENINIPEPDDDIIKEFKELYNQRINCPLEEIERIEQTIDEAVCKLYSLSSEEKEYINGLN